MELGGIDEKRAQALLRQTGGSVESALVLIETERGTT
jgi:hypothetical protein